MIIICAIFNIILIIYNIYAILSRNNQYICIYMLKNVKYAKIFKKSLSKVYVTNLMNQIYITLYLILAVWNKYD